MLTEIGGVSIFIVVLGLRQLYDIMMRRLEFCAKFLLAIFHGYLSIIRHLPFKKFVMALPAYKILL